MTCKLLNDQKSQRRNSKRGFCVGAGAVPEFWNPYCIALTTVFRQDGSVLLCMQMNKKRNLDDRASCPLPGNDGARNTRIGVGTRTKPLRQTRQLAAETAAVSLAQQERLILR